MLFSVTDFAKQCLWDPVADVPLLYIVLILLPGLIFDLGWGYLVRTGGVVLHRGRAAVRRRRWASRIGLLRKDYWVLSGQLQAGRRRLKELRQAGDYREAEAALRRVRLMVAERAVVKEKIQALEAAPFLPSVSIIVPCHNSEAVIEGTLVSLCMLDYPVLEIIVVDDGSTDATAKKVRDFIEDRAVAVPKAAGGGTPGSGRDCHIRLVSRLHTAGLKASAVNFGLSFATGDVAVVVDDDTIIAPDSLKWLVEPLAGAGVAASGGNIKVDAEPRNLLVKLQELEYLQTMEVGREWQSLAFRRVFVISGSFGAFKRDFLTRIGEYDIVTVTEDLDVTWKLYRLRGEVRFADKAEAITVVPTCIKSLARQRRRWDLGMLQTLVRHRNFFFDRRFGAFSMLLLPEVAVLELMLPLLRPLYIAIILILGLSFHVINFQTVLLLTVYFYLFMEGISILTGGLLSSKKRMALKIYYAPLMLLYRIWLTIIRISTLGRFFSGSSKAEW